MCIVKQLSLPTFLARRITRFEFKISWQIYYKFLYNKRLKGVDFLKYLVRAHQRLIKSCLYRNTIFFMGSNNGLVIFPINPFLPF